MLARSAGRTGAWTLDAVMEAFPNLKDRRRSLAGTLSGGEQQATAIGRALMMNPELLLLDEVSLGLSPLVVDRVYVRLETLKSSGVAMLLVEQDLKRAMAAASRTICMLEGAIAIEGPTRTLTPRASHRSLFRPQEAVARRGARRHDLRQPDPPGRPARRLLRADRLRAVVHVRRHADHQPRARQPRGAVRLRALRSGRPFRHPAVPRPPARRAG